MMLKQSGKMNLDIVLELISPTASAGLLPTAFRMGTRVASTS